MLKLWKWKKGNLRNGPKSSSFRPAVENLEERIALSWAGTPPATIQPPGSFTSVTLNSRFDATGTATISSTEVDYFRFTAPRTGAYRISATTPLSNLDPVLGVFNAAGTRLAYNDDTSDVDADSRLTVSLQAGARYYLGVTNYTGTPGGKYTWTIDGDDVYEENDTLSAAYNLGALTEGHAITGLQLWDAGDWFRFTQSQAATFNGYVSIDFSHAEGDLDLYLYNSQGTLLRRSDGTSNTEQVSLNALAAGTYFVKVVGYKGARSSNYSLAINPGSESPPPVEGTFDIVLDLSGFTDSQAATFELAAQRWEQIIAADLPDMFYGGEVVDDLLIEGQSIAIDGPGDVLGQAGPDAFRNGSFLPYYGTMEFDQADLAEMESDGSLFSVIVHEMGHVLGIGTIWENLNLIVGAGTSNSRFVGAQAIAAYNQIFGVSESSVPLESTGGEGTRDSHWRDTVFANEIMTGWVDAGTNPISRVTVAAMADMGYTVNFDAADAYAPPAQQTTSQSSSSGPARSVLRGSPKGKHSKDWRDAIEALKENKARDKDYWIRSADSFFSSLVA